MIPRAAAEDAGFIEAGVMAARVSLALGDTAAAERVARQVSPETINRGDLRSLLGSLALQKGEVGGAERVFRDLQERLPQEGWGPWGLGLVALARGDRVAALPLLAAGRALLPEHPEGEAYVRRHFRDRWMRRETAPEDDAFVAAFPALGDVRERFRNPYE